jgi:thiamine biosynthesis lipoprotein
MSTTTAPRTLHVEHCMGTVFTIDIRDPGGWQDAVDDVVAWLHRVDRIFSTYRADSDISRMRHGELALGGADPDVGTVLDLCATMQLTTGGAFSALRAGRIDPTGLVKGWAIERASRLLREAGAANHCVNGGGDVQLAGVPAPNREWVVGITDPHDRSALLTTVSGADFAVATSGTAERGEHIVDPATGRPATGLVSVTVVGPSLTDADCFATAAFVKGERALAWIETLDGYECLLVTSDATVRTTSGWHKRHP